MENNMKNNSDFLAMVEIMKDNAHCPAHRNCEKCVYAEDNTMCSLMIKAAKLVHAGFTKQPYNVGDTVYVAMQYLPVVKRMTIINIRYNKNNRRSSTWIECKEYRTDQIFTFAHDDFGNYIFHKKEDAESVIKTWKQNGLR